MIAPPTWPLVVVAAQSSFCTLVGLSLPFFMVWMAFRLEMEPPIVGVVCSVATWSARFFVRRGTDLARGLSYPSWLLSISNTTILTGPSSPSHLPTGHKEGSTHRTGRDGGCPR